MRERSRFRRTAKWVALCLCAVLFVAFALSIPWAWNVARVFDSIMLSEGQISWHSVGATDGWPTGVYWNQKWRVDWKFEVWPNWSGLRSGFINVPLWMPFVAAAVPTAVLWHRDRRRILPNHCQRCGYDLTGNVSGRCPECGEAV